MPDNSSLTLFDRAAQRVAIIRPLKLRDFRLFWAGLGVSLIGDGIYLAASAWQALELDGSPDSIAVIGAAWMAPQVVVLLIGGVLADRYDLRKLIIVADLIRMVALLGLAVLALSDVIEIWHMVLLSVLYGIGDGLFGPAFGAIVPHLVPPRLRTQANALDQFVRPVAFYMIGPAVGGILIDQVGAGSAFALDAITFLYSIIVVLMIKKTTQDFSEREGVTVRGALREIREGFIFVRSQRWLWASLLAGAFLLFCYWGPIEVLIPFLVKESREAGGIGGTAQDYGLVLAAGGVGAVMMSIVVAARGLPRKFILVMWLCWGVGCGLVGTVALAEQTWHAMIALFVSEGVASAGIIIWATLLQNYVPEELRGRVMSLDWFVSVSLMPLSFILVAPVSHWIGAKATLAGAGALAALVSVGLLFVPKVRAIEKQPRRSLDQEAGMPPPYSLPE